MNASAEFFGGYLERGRVMVILRNFSPERTVELCETAAACGAGLIEVPVQSPSAFPSLAAAVEWGRWSGVPVGAGTVTTGALVRQVNEVGVLFTVAPGLDEEVVAESEQFRLPHLPGVGTATEVQTAHRLGFSWLKAFPASLLTAAWISAMRGPFPEVRFVATGGIDVANGAEFLAAGAGAVSLGSGFANADPASVRALAVDGG